MGMETIHQVLMLSRVAIVFSMVVLPILEVILLSSGVLPRVPSTPPGTAFCTSAVAL
jgi:hypothetical protein